MAALAISFYLLYKTHLERVKILILTSDSVRLVVQKGSEHTPKFNLLCNFANDSSRLATVHRLEAQVRTPEKRILPFVWKLFYGYRPGGKIMEKTTDTHPIAIPPKDSSFTGIQFEGPTFQEPFDWIEGTYEIEIRGWVNRRNRKQVFNATALFHVVITAGDCALLRRYTDATEDDPEIAADPHKAISVPIEVKEWRLS